MTKILIFYLSHINNNINEYFSYKKIISQIKMKNIFKKLLII